MMLIEQTTVPDAVLPVAALKAHLRVGTGFGEDSLQDGVLQGFLRAAIAAVEARTNKVLVERDFALVLSVWQNAMCQSLPVAPVNAVLAVHLLNHLGEETEIDPASYWLEPDGHRPRLRPRAVLLPSVPAEGSVRVRFRAGYAPEFGDIPADLAQAVLLIAAHYYEFRNETDMSGKSMPFGALSLIERYKSLSLRMGRG